MMNVKEAIRNNLMVELDKCLSSLIRYDVDSLMPLFYVLCAHHEGHLVSIVGEGKSLFHGKMHIQPIEIVDGYESPLLKEIRNSVNPSFFEGQSAEAVFQFYSMCNEYINEFYQDIIEHIISVYTSNAGKYSGVSVTTQEIAQLMGYFITDCAPRRVYDPCAGLCSFAILPELSKIEFVCSELSNRTKVIADIRLNAAGKQLEINQEDCTFNWRGNSNCDCLASELPFGLRLNDRSLDERRPLLYKRVYSVKAHLKFVLYFLHTIPFCNVCIWSLRGKISINMLFTPVSLTTVECLWNFILLRHNKNP